MSSFWVSTHFSYNTSTSLGNSSSRSFLLLSTNKDEPSNDLDVEVLRSLEEALLDFAGCAFVVSHDRYFLDRIATHILACEGDSKWFWFPGNYGEYEQNRIERLGETSIKPITYAPLVM